MGHQLSFHIAEMLASTCQQNLTNSLGCIYKCAKWLIQEKSVDKIVSGQMPVATPSRAVTQFWSKFKVTKAYTNPMLPKKGSETVGDAAGGASASAPEPVATEPDLPRPEATAGDAGGTSAPEPVSTEPEATVADAGAASAPEPMSTEPDLPRPEATDAGESGNAEPTSTDTTIPDPVRKVQGARPPVEARVPEYVQAMTRIPDPNLLWTDPAAKDMKMEPLKIEKKPVVKEEASSPTFDPVVAGECDRFIASGGLIPIQERLDKLDDHEARQRIEGFRSNPSLPSFVAYIRDTEKKCTGVKAQYEFGSTDDLQGELTGFEAWLHAENMVNKSLTPAKIPEKKSSPLSVVKAVLTRATTVDLTPTPPTACLTSPTSSVPKTSAATAPVASQPDAPAGGDQREVAPNVASLDARSMLLRKLCHVQCPLQYIYMVSA